MAVVVTCLPLSATIYIHKIASAALRKPNMLYMQKQPDNHVGGNWWGQSSWIAHLKICTIATPGINRISSFSSVSLLLSAPPPTPFYKAPNLSHYLVLMLHFIKIGLDSLGPEVHVTCGQEEEEEGAAAVPPRTTSRRLCWQQQERPSQQNARMCGHQLFFNCERVQYTN